MGDLGSIPGLGRSPVEGKGYPLQYSGLENSIDCIVHGVSKRQTRIGKGMEKQKLLDSITIYTSQNNNLEEQFGNI